MKRALRRFEKAAVNMSWRGGAQPETVSTIEKEYRRAKILLIEKISNLETTSICHVSTLRNFSF
jgi:hypothetical protein